MKAFLSQTFGTYFIKFIGKISNIYIWYLSFQYQSVNMVSSVNKYKISLEPANRISEKVRPGLHVNPNAENAPECGCLHKELYRIQEQSVSDSYGAVYTKPQSDLNLNPTHFGDPVSCKWGLRKLLRQTIGARESNTKK